MHRYAGSKEWGTQLIWPVTSPPPLLPALQADAGLLKNRKLFDKAVEQAQHYVDLKVSRRSTMWT